MTYFTKEGMMLKVRELLEAKMARLPALTDPEMISKVHRAATTLYQNIAHDLPRHGQGHYHGAHDFINDAIFDLGRMKEGKGSHHYAADLSGHNAIPGVHEFNFEPHVKNALKDYVPDDRAETRNYEAKRARQAKRTINVSELPNFGRPKGIKTWDQKPPPPKSKRGVGSW